MRRQPYGEQGKEGFGWTEQSTGLAVTMQCDFGAPDELGVTSCSLCIRKVSPWRLTL